MALQRILQEGAAEMGYPLSAGALSRFQRYFELLEEKNKVMNLTAISGEEDVARLHFLDCLGVLGAEKLAGKRLIDVGTGAGFPGMALKIAEPSLELTLLDSLGKRIDFLKEVCQNLEITDIDFRAARAEEAAAELREQFDFATSRAVAGLSMLCELCLPFVKVGGAMLAMKGPDCEEEMNGAKNAVKLLGGRFESPVDYRIPGTDIVHRVVVIRKIEKTPAKYPRRFAKIKKEPL